MKTAFNPQRQNYVKYDDTHFLLFLNEQETEQTDEQTNETVKGYSYTGAREDGSTLIEATNVTNENRRSKFIAGLIGTRYTKDDQIALLANGEDTAAHAIELGEFNAFRRYAKQAVDELLARNI